MVVGASATPNDGSVSLSPAQPVVDTAVTARLTDPDGTPTGRVSWQWEWSTSSSASGSWTAISGATSASYTPVKADGGRYLRATATYTDADGPNQTAVGITANAVAIHRYDSNADGEIDRGEVIAAITEFLFGSGANKITRDEVIEVINLFLGFG